MLPSLSVLPLFTLVLNRVIGLRNIYRECFIDHFTNRYLPDAERDDMPMKKFIKSSILMVFAGLLITIAHPLLADQSPETDQQKCVEYLKKCFSPEDYEYIGDISVLSINECWVACKSTYDNDFSCDFDTCLEMCKVASGHSKNACPIPTDPLD